MSDNNNTFAVWTISPNHKETFENLTEAEAVAKYDEKCNLYTGSHWNRIDKMYMPLRVSKFQKGADLVVIGIIDTDAPPAPPRGVAHWLTRVPEKVVQS
jgi:phosphatidylethanolamine-binding protein (PEBP) family uncharacterized protein